jgi:hypothetical protein
VLTNYYQFFFQKHASYKPNKYSDFAKMKIFTDFQILPGYNKSMENYPIFESESFSGGIENGGIKDLCSNGCKCTSEHITIYPQDI